MTPELTKKLDRIKAACRKALELDAKASRGYVHRPDDEPCMIYVGSDLHGQTISLNTNRPSYDGQFIAYSRTITPDMAKAMLTTIETLTYTAERGLRYSVECLQSIADSFTETSLP